MYSEHAYLAFGVHKDSDLFNLQFRNRGLWSDDENKAKVDIIAKDYRNGKLKGSPEEDGDPNILVITNADYLKYKLQKESEESTHPKEQ